MTNGATAGAAASAVAATANAIKASGAIVRVEPFEFLNILSKIEYPLVVCSLGGFLTSFKYLTSYKGLIFYAKSKEPLNIAEEIELIVAKKIWIPD